MLPSDLANLLNNLRNRLRRVLAWEACGRAVVALGLLFWFGLLFDWLLEPSPAVRLIAILATAMSIIIWLGRTVLQPLLMPIDDRQLALLVEDRQPKLADSLITAVDLTSNAQTSGQSANFDPVLLDSTTDKARHVLSTHGQPDVVSPLRMRRWLTGAAVAAASILFFAFASTDAFATYARRLALSPEAWPRRVHLVPEGFTKSDAGVWKRVVAIGESVDVTILADLSGQHILPRQIKARITQADALTLRDSFAKVGTPTDGPNPSQRFRLSLGEVHSDLSLRVRGGDARLGPLEIHVAPRPVVVAADATISPPDYTGSPPKTLPAIAMEDILEGSSVKIAVTASKPLESASATWLSPTGAEEAERAPSAKLDLQTGERKFQVQIPPLSESAVLQIELVDMDDIRTAEPHAIRLRVAADKSPTTTLKLVGVGPLITPDARIALAIEASDDHAVGSGHLEITVDEGEPQVLPIDSLVASPSSIELEQEIDLLTHQFQTEATLPEGQHQPTQAKSARLIAGQRLAIRSHVTDTYNLADAPHAAASPWVRLEVVTLNALLARLEEREIDLRRTFEQTTSDMRGVARQVENLVEETLHTESTDQNTKVETKTGNEQDETKQTATERLRYVRASDELTEVTQSTLAVGAAFRQIHQELVYNRVPNTELIDRIDAAIASPLERLAEEELTQLAGRMQADIYAPKVAQLASRTAGKMEQILEQMQSLETYNEVLAMLRGMIDEQQRLKRATEKTRREMVRKSLFE